MLLAEPRIHYRVWPSWANSFPFTWEQMYNYLKDPVGSGRLNDIAIACLKRGEYQNTAEICGYYGNSFGNGVFSYRELEKRWIGEALFSAEAEDCAIGGMELIRNLPFASIVYYRLRGDAWLQWGFGGTNKPKEYRCKATLEHVEAAGERVFWLADIATGRGKVIGLELISEVAKSFGLSVVPTELPEVGEQILKEIEPWFPNRNEMRWFEVVNGESKAGMQLAFMYYTALHVRSIAKKRFRNMHLIGQIEGRPNIRCTWDRSLQDGTWKWQ